MHEEAGTPLIRIKLTSVELPIWCRDNRRLLPLLEDLTLFPNSCQVPHSTRYSSTGFHGFPRPTESHLLIFSHAKSYSKQVALSHSTSPYSSFHNSRKATFDKLPLKTKLPQHMPSVQDVLSLMRYPSHYIQSSLYTPSPPLRNNPITASTRPNNPALTFTGAML